MAAGYNVAAAQIYSSAHKGGVRSSAKTLIKQSQTMSRVAIKQ
jgi:hypothetical protein